MKGRYIMIDIDDMKRQNLNRFINEFNIKKSDFSEEMGFSAQYLSALLKPKGAKGTRTVSPELIEKISRTYDIEEEYFYKGLYQTSHEDFALIPKYKSVVSGTGSFENEDQVSV